MRYIWVRVNLKITNIKITKDALFDSFIFEFIFSLFINYLHNLIIFQIVIFNVFFFNFSVFNFENSLIFQIEQFPICDHFLNQSIIAIWKMANFPNYKFWEFSIRRSRIIIVWVPLLGFDPYCEGNWLLLQDEFTPSINSKKFFLQKL